MTFDFLGEAQDAHNRHEDRKVKAKEKKARDQALVRNQALEQAAQIVDDSIGGGSEISADIRALKEMS